MKIISWNINGLRAIWKKGFSGWLKNCGVDIVCLQEIKAREKDISAIKKGISEMLDNDSETTKNDSETTTIDSETTFSESIFSFAEKPGYSGVAVLSKIKPIKYEKKIGLSRFDSEGRIIISEFPNFALLNLYLPHGGRQKENLGYKLNVYKFLLDYLKKQKNKNIILIGDFNIAHTDLDLDRPKQNKNNIMFTPEEKHQIDDIVKLGFTDTFRMFHKNGGHYTWWPYFANARERNLGWRIDYCFVSRPLVPRVKNAFILPKVTGSDHCPIGIEIF
ncbi:MAG: exodeoxyribonuclease III [Candidatus Portnoybacteria bacterium RBG_13_41_18]|uniref:Exodeoxyribonuclease III n=1 Tax=Candidatus Portnoybacteria bacterium RBG_13_41_18 TaxID=1801991 RepID=A0A1G2F5R9_9BACT|nr:MAG: exodeoxyribonuclease III [Candidatus Portnoybacteria bacterium RBG_13_41_18]